MNQLIILTSRRNFAWISMEEIIAWIERSWAGWAASRNYSVKILNVDEMKFSELLKETLQSELIVVTCFNASVSANLVHLRKTAQVTSPWVFYVHGLASFGFWPLFKYGMGEVLTGADTFVVSCRRDKKQVDLIFKDLPVAVIPFSLETKNFTEKKLGPVRKFAFIGRLSSQKNLHTLLVAFSGLKGLPWELHFFGKEDNYGSPLMGKRETGYGQYLEDLAKKLDVDVKFHGFCPREKIEALMESEQWVFVAPSIHSDENFGMAAFRCLINGHSALLSNWGGHADYEQYFQVNYVNVYSSKVGPFISVDELKKEIRSLVESPRIQRAGMPESYEEDSIFRSYDKLWDQRQKNPQPLTTTPLLQEVLTRKNRYPEEARIYQDYQDPFLQPFYSAYGMTSWTPTEIGSVKVPWLSEGGEVHDPHRGEYQVNPNAVAELTSMGLLYKN